MPKKAITHQEKGRWILVNSNSENDRNLVEVIKTISACEIKIVSGRIYARFPIRIEKKRKKSYSLKRKFINRTQNKNKEFNNYCAVILKT